jgi:N-acetyl-gamma-glutamyl-phosphate reductase
MDVALFGASGYAGLEVAKLLAVHPGARLVCAASDTHAGKLVGELTGRDHGGLRFTTTAETREIAARCAAAMIATPPEAALAIAAELRGIKLVDLSHAHRDQAVYGLTTLFAADAATATLIANPGCYATAVITAAAPLVRAGIVDGDLVATAGSGVTGAGRQASEAYSLGELYGDVRAYKVLRHQHGAEIAMALARVAPEAAPRVILTTQLLPIARGIFVTLVARLAQPTDVPALYKAAYAADPTVVLAGTAEDVTLRKVVGTNQCLLGVTATERDVVVTAAIDNLLKGAAGQAIENLNLMLGLPRLAGLEHLARHA